jgi:hypothetical protein
MAKPPSIQVIEPHIPNHVVCPFCGFKQPFIKETQYWRTVKAPNLKHPLTLKIRMVCAKCQNPDCSYESFALAAEGIQRFQRATRALIDVRRQIETVRRGFITDQGRPNHLKLFQIKSFPKEPIKQPSI